MRLSEKEWENIEFRKKKYRQLKSALDGAVTGRGNKVSSFVIGDDGVYTVKDLDKLVSELVKSMDEYGRRDNLWKKTAVAGKDKGTDTETSMPDRFREFVSDYLYCMIRLMVSNMEWVEKVFAWPFEDSFQQILNHSEKVRKLAQRYVFDRYNELWYECYYGMRGEDLVFDVFTLAYESLTNTDISCSLSPAMKEMLDKYCHEQDEMYKEFLNEAEEDVMTDEEIQKALAEAYEDGSYPDDTSAEGEYDRYLDEMMDKAIRNEEEFLQQFIGRDIYCKRYIRLRELFYLNCDDDDMRYPLSIFDNLVEGMLDVFLCRRGMSLYADVDEFVRSYTYIKRQIDKIKKIADEVSI